MKTVRFIAVGLLSVPMVLAAQQPSVAVSEILTLDADVAYGEYLAGECATCHNPQGSTTTSVPVIHGRSAESIVEGLVAYRSGERKNITMQGVAGALGNEEIAALAKFLSSGSAIE
jgi:cytochrome c